MPRQKGRAEAPAPLRLGISACLLGHAVRWDGGTKRNPFLVRTLGRWVEWVPMCPEVELGLGVPREPIRLEGDPAAPRLVGVTSRRDHTAAMRSLAAARVAALARLGIAGFVLKSDSPSCGVRGVPVFGPSGTRAGVGAFARVLLEQLALLPVEEERDLADPRRREAFLERVFAYDRWRRFVAAEPGRAELAAFHAAHELQLRAHSSAGCERLGRLVARAGERPFAAVLRAYGEQFMTVLRLPATTARHARVLRDAAGWLARTLPPAARHELDDAVEDYRRGAVARVVPLTLLRQHARRRHDAYLAGQAYLAPYPRALMRAHRA